jgi:hypothetical protein
VAGGNIGVGAGPGGVPRIDDRSAPLAARPAAPFDAKWDGGFIEPDAFAGLVCEDLAHG